MRLKIGKKLKTAGLNSRFTGAKKEQCTSTSTLLKILETYCCCLHKSIPTNNLKSAICHLNNCGMVKVVLFFYIDAKISLNSNVL